MGIKVGEFRGETRTQTTLVYFVIGSIPTVRLATGPDLNFLRLVTPRSSANALPVMIITVNL